MKYWPCSFYYIQKQTIFKLCDKMNDTQQNIAERCTQQKPIKSQNKNLQMKHIYSFLRTTS